MTRTAAKPLRWSDLSLYATEDEIAAAVCGRNKSQWPSLAPVLEREGLPQIDPIIGGRYVPAVKAWFDAKNGLGKSPEAVDGQEEWSGWGKRRRA